MTNIFKNDTYQNAVDILTSQGKFYINLGLERIIQILDLIGNPQKNMKFIHVAGTNGKGSVCAILSSILTEAGFKTGLFTSPHVFEYTERIKINNIDIQKEDFAKNVIKITELAQKNNIYLTEFEILTAVAFDYFAQNKTDIIVLETGLGGRLDSTNVIEKNICSIITHIDFDHTERLGNTIEKIAFEKAGIIKQGCPVIIGKNNLGFKVIEKTAKEKNSQILVAYEGQNFMKENFALKGIYQNENLALVMLAIEVLKKEGFVIPQESIDNGLKKVKHPCRFEYLKEQNMIIDGAHNPNGMKALRESLDYYFPNQTIKFIFGCLRNKNYPEMMKNIFISSSENTGQLATFIPEIYFYHFDNPNSCTYEELAKACELTSFPFESYKKDNSLTVVCGSFYMIKDLLTKMGIK